MTPEEQEAAGWQAVRNDWERDQWAYLDRLDREAEAAEEEARNERDKLTP